LKRKKNGLDILLTTYPASGSKNVGDKFITESAIELVRIRVPRYDPLIIFREDPLDQYEKESVRTILAPGFSVKDGTYPDIFCLYKNLSNLPDGFYPVGCSFQHWIPLQRTYESYEYTEKTLDFLRLIVQRSGAIPCRDLLIVDLLNRNNVPAFYCGDLVLYDHDVIGSKFTPPESIQSVVFTIQHKPKFSKQSFEMLDLIRSEFPDATLYVAYHSEANEKSKEVAGYAKSLGYIEINMAGRVEGLSLYDEIDLHIGYRLHGHIYFLRKRKPSLLLIEDARAFGIANTGPLSVGTFDAVTADGTSVDDSAPQRVIEYARHQVRNGFEDYFEVFCYIDKTYSAVVRPYFDQFASRLGWRRYGLRQFFKWILSFR